ncbi:tetratricopeptide repeat protein [Hymenobacter cellulosilyticus]|uniref:Tetratricopeptide repeat protein n=1 Tax=Hymenobacter cellulosilyticus TaxID=2932248 RepID=A0A8T9Q0D3_9BACT|nr:tetratricopeptide repeat protein [Hymenobacter cellulosilyticus]UOQ70475.1 tetratricopeptide repeat protein [Hymenobacter cellulosilyticus]
MRILLIVVLLALPSWASLTRIRDRNQAVQQAEAAYSRKEFAQAAQLYRYAIEKLGAQEEAVLLNAGHAYARAGQPVAARTYYGRLLTSPAPAVRSIARQQLAVLAAQKGEYAQAVGLLRQALLADPANKSARYNYELLRDYLARRHNEPKMPPPAEQQGKPEESSKQNQQEQTRPGQDKQGQLNDPTQPEDPRNNAQLRPDQAGQRNPNQSSPGAGKQAGENFQPGSGPQQRVAQGSQPGSTRGLDSGTAAEPNGARSQQAGSEQASLNDTQLQTQRERLQQMNLSQGQARQLLDALRTAEEQYLQQMPRRSTRKPDPKKPTW